MAASKSTTKKSSKKVIEIPMTVSRDTKNTRRYESDDEDAVVTTLYVNKSASTPDNITLTIS